MDSSDDDDLFNFKKRALNASRCNKASPRERCEERVGSDDSSYDGSSSSQDSPNHRTSSTRTRPCKKKFRSYDEDDDSSSIPIVQEIMPKQSVIALDSDDDSDAGTGPNNVEKTSLEDLLCRDKETKNALLKAREARSALMKNDDVLVNAEDNDDMNSDVEQDIKNEACSAKHDQVIILGPTIQLQLRTTSPSQGTNVSHFTVGMNETFASLMQKYKVKFNLPPSITVKMSFDGENLLPHSTPKSIEMEDDDLVDVIVAQSSTHAGLQSTSKVPTPSADTITIVTRVKGGDPRFIHRYILKLNDPFQKLLDAYRKEHGYSTFKPLSLEFGGKPIDPNFTPKKLQMKGEVEIEVIDTEEKLKQLERSGRIDESLLDDESQPNPDANKLSLKLRVKYTGEKNISEQSFGLGLHERFSLLIDQFCQKNNLSKSECKFTFDGVDLKFNETPDDEGLEGGEIIDVFVQRSLKAAPIIASNVNVTQSQTAHATTTIQPHVQIISIHTLRNNTGRPRKFTLNNGDPFSKLTAAYIKTYYSKGCTSVQFYRKGVLIRDHNRTIREIGVQNSETLIAMENGSSLEL